MCHYSVVCLFDYRHVLIVEASLVGNAELQEKTGVATPLTHVEARRQDAIDLPLWVMDLHSLTRSGGGSMDFAATTG
jgi:hypothetical protein